MDKVKNKYIKKANVMRYFILYLLFTIVLYFWGPINWKTQNSGILLILLIGYPVALLLGYKFSENKNLIGSYSDYKSCNSLSLGEEKRIRLLLLIGIVFDFLMIVRMANSWSISTIFGKVLNGLISPSEEYSQYYLEASQGNLWGGGLFSLFITLGSPFCIAGIILGVFYFPNLNNQNRILTLLLIVFHLCAKLISSANEGLFDLAIYICMSIFVRHMNNKLKAQNENKHFFSFKKIVILLVIIVTILFVYSFFSANIMGRTKGNFAFGTLGGNTYNESNWLKNILPESIYSTFVYFTVYITEGYYGFSLATTLDWSPMFGTGFSSFIYNNVSEIFGVDLFKYSYQVRIENVYNWGALKNFHSAYTFWANDVSFYGVFLVMFLIGYIFFKIYKKAITKCDKSSIILFPLFVTLLFYLPANNKVFIQPASFLLIIYILLYKLFTNGNRVRT